MKALFASAAALAVVAVALPAAAQSWDPGYGRGAPYGDAYGRNGFARGPNNFAADRIAQRIDQGFRNGALTPNEARNLQSRLESVRQLEWRYGRDGYISPSEGRALDRRYADLESRVYAQLRDNDRRGYGYGYGYRR
jgi:hypothetical protein